MSSRPFRRAHSGRNLLIALAAVAALTLAAFCWAVV